MADEGTRRALDSQRRRHTARALKLAEDIREYAGYIIRDLEAGQPVTYRLTADAVDLDKRVAMLEAIRDTEEIFAADPEPTP